MTDFSYLGINEKGDAVAIVIDDPRFKKDTARTIAQWIKDGRTVERHEHHAACARLKADWEKRLSERKQSVLPM